VKAESAATTEARGSVLDVLHELLARGHDAAVLELVAKLVSRNEELEQMLAKLRAGKHHNERIPKEQLDLFLDLLRAASATTLATANEQLEKTAQDNGGRPDPRTQTPAKQPPVRRPPPPGLPRVPNPIPVPAAERPCPVCGKERVAGLCRERSCWRGSGTGMMIPHTVSTSMCHGSSGGSELRRSSSRRSGGLGTG
jgi:hypothetical protein